MFAQQPMSSCNGNRVKGVRYKHDRAGWICEWTIQGKTQTKFFSERDCVGYDEAFSRAVQHKADMEQLKRYGA